MEPRNAGEYLSLEPSAIRLFLYHLVEAGLVLCVVWAWLSYRGEADGIPIVFLLAFVLVLAGGRSAMDLLFDRERVVIDDGVIHGRSGSPSFTVASLDLDHSGQNSFWRRVTCTIVLQSRGDERLELFTPYYRPEELDAMLRLIGLRAGA